MSVTFSDTCRYGVVVRHIQGFRERGRERQDEENKLTPKCSCPTASDTEGSSVLVLVCRNKVTDIYPDKQ